MEIALFRGMKQNSVIFLTGALWIVGCAQVDSTKVSQSEIYTHYEASYAESEQALRFHADFTVGQGIGTSVRLSGNSAVLANGIALKEIQSIAHDVYYESIQPNKSSEEATGAQQEFEYRNNDGNIFSNFFFIPQRISVDVPASSRLSDGFTLSWAIADRIGQNELIDASLNTDYGLISGVAGANPTGASSGRMAFSSESLAKIKPQTATILVCRKIYFNSIHAPDVGGSLEARYCAAEKSIDLR